MAVDRLASHQLCTAGPITTDRSSPPVTTAQSQREHRANRYIHRPHRPRTLSRIGMVQDEVTVCRYSLRESTPFREANGDFALNLKFSTARIHQVRVARTLNPLAQKGRSATSPDLVLTSACRLHNRKIESAISQYCH